MCGLFGFISQNGTGPNIERLQKMAIETETRGRHAFGLIWIDAWGEMNTFKRVGAASNDLDDLEVVRDAQIVVGHCRYATHGHQSDPRNNHPHRAGRGWIAHNGVVHNHEWLTRLHGFAKHKQSECDSEVLGMLIAKTPGPLVVRGARTALAAEGQLAILGVWANPARLLVVRRGNPLWIGETAGGAYFSSLPDALPGTSEKIPDDHAMLLTFAKGRVGRPEVVRIGE